MAYRNKQAKAIKYLMDNQLFNGEGIVKLLACIINQF